MPLLPFLYLLCKIIEDLDVSSTNPLNWPGILRCRLQISHALPVNLTATLVKFDQLQEYLVIGELVDGGKACAYFAVLDAADPIQEIGITVHYICYTVK